MALLCVHSTSVTNCQNLLPFSAKPATFLSKTFTKYSQWYTSFWQFPWRNYFLQISGEQFSIENTFKIFDWKKTANLSSVIEKANNIEGKGNKAKKEYSRQIAENFNGSAFQIRQFYNVRKSRKISPYKQMIAIKRQLKFLNRNAVSAWKTTCKNLRKIIRSNVWDAEIGCTYSLLHSMKNASTAVESCSERKSARFRSGSRKFR